MSLYYLFTQSEAYAGPFDLGRKIKIEYFRQIFFFDARPVVGYFNYYHAVRRRRRRFDRNASAAVNGFDSVFQNI